MARRWNVAGASRHANSNKLAIAEELQGLVSFGHRGQALHALAAASLLGTIMGSPRPGGPHNPLAVPGTRAAGNLSGNA